MLSSPEAFLRTQKYPDRKLQASPEPYLFRQGSAEDEARVRRIFQSIFKIDDLDSFLAACGTQAFIVIQNDTILYEGYFNGAKHDTMVTSFSMAKSFIGPGGHSIGRRTHRQRERFRKQVPAKARRSTSSPKAISDSSSTSHHKRI